MIPTQNKPLVSVIIPVYNCERYLAEAINSVLAQTYRQHEIIVVDDGSTDDSANVAERYASAVRYCHQSHAGIGAARNRGVKMAQGSFLSFLDADDLWVEDKTALQMMAFEQDPSLDMVFGHAIEFRSPEIEGAAEQAAPGHGDGMPGIISGATLIRRTSFLQIGLFSTEWQVGEFIDWYLKATECGLKSTMVPQIVLKRRLHDSNTGILKRDSQVHYVRILKAALDRRRRTAQPGSTQTGGDGEIGLDHE
jgi:glycosyltransferase involved in cell wall biosynthesis